ncbi:MAG: hypothetical protein OXK76_16340 [Gammaproteobacteria bacterium]|nr:hypothetical protein [Gammaproteobacteria bacterium]
MIVPPSIGFSRDFDTCRQLLFQGYSQNWFSSFGRIPSALFSFDVRVRNVIHLAHKGAWRHVQMTPRLHRWFDIARPHLFDQIQYTAFRPEVWAGRIPKINTTRIAQTFARLFSSASARVETQTARLSTRHVLYFRKTAYNWLNFCRRHPPSYDLRGKAIPQTEFGQVYFDHEETLQLAMLLANGKLVLLYWLMVPDDSM